MLNIGIVGLGDGGMSNYRSLINLPDVRVVAVCDSDEAKLNQPELAQNLRQCSDHQEMLFSYPEIDLIIVATPDHLHLKVAEDVLKAGKHVFVEKPLATSMEDLVIFKKLADTFREKLHFGEKYSFAYPIETALQYRDQLGEFFAGSTSYVMWRCGRIMGDGKWRTESAYNPCAGGLSHNFMTALLFVGSPIKRISALGSILTYHKNLVKNEGYDAMQGILEFENGKYLTWNICLAVEGEGSAFAHRTVSHSFQFKYGALVYGPNPDDDLFVVGTERLTSVPTEPGEKDWSDYNINVLYGRMHKDLINALVTGKAMRHSVEQGINVAAACIYAFNSARNGGTWMPLPSWAMF